MDDYAAQLLLSVLASAMQLVTRVAEWYLKAALTLTGVLALCVVVDTIVQERRGEQ